MPIKADHIITIKCLSADKERIKILAKEAGLSLSAYMIAKALDRKL